jgi:hypothetical protein
VAQSAGTAPPKELTLVGQLKAAGIFVDLPELPVAKSPASILFQAAAPEPEPGGPVESVPLAVEHEFSWLAGPSRPAPPAPSRGQSGGLPKRLPVPPAGPSVTSSAAEPTQRTIVPVAKPTAQRASAPASPPAAELKPGELPKRVPKANLLAPAVRPTRPVPAPPRTPASADRARGFLSSFQAGVRMSSSADGAGNDPMGEEKP